MTPLGSISPLFKLFNFRLQFRYESLKLCLLLVLGLALLLQVLQLVVVGLAQLRDLRPVDADGKTGDPRLLSEELQVMNSVNVFTQQIIQVFQAQKSSGEVIVTVLLNYSGTISGGGGGFLC